MTHKRCPRCGKTKSLSDFPRSKHTKSGVAGWCKVCNREVSAKWRGTPSGIYTTLKSQAKFRQHHPFHLERQEFITWYNRQEKKCAYCDIREEDTHKIGDGFNNKVSRLTIDCVDGDVGYMIGNIVLACHRCNTVKSDIFTYEEMRYIGQHFIKPKWQKKLGHL